MSKLSNAITKIEKQQPKERTAVWMVGEQLKDILRHEPHLAELVNQDLDQKALSLANCEKQIKAYADKHKTGNFACVIPVRRSGLSGSFMGWSVRRARKPWSRRSRSRHPSGAG